MGNFHTPVLLREAIDFLRVKPGEKYIDATLGGGGHTEEILRRKGKVLGIDYDPEAIEYVKNKVKSPPFVKTTEGRQESKVKSSLTLVWGNFKDLKNIALSNNFDKVAGIIFDLGVSTHQLLTPSRGFSFNSDAVLDMRMDPQLKVTAADLINGLGKGELYELFSKLGEEHNALAVVQAIVGARALAPIKTCNELAQIVLRVNPRRGHFDRTHPATRIFQALRIAVNDELNNLKEALPQAVELLAPGGRLIAISFHSLEDRIVKKFFKEEKNLTILTKHPLRPSKQEIRDNPRSRAAKMRAAERV